MPFFLGVHATQFRLGSVWLSMGTFGVALRFINSSVHFSPFHFTLSRFLDWDWEICLKRGRGEVGFDIRSYLFYFVGLISTFEKGEGRRYEKRSKWQCRQGRKDRWYLVVPVFLINSYLFELGSPQNVLKLRPSEFLWRKSPTMLSPHYWTMAK